MPAHSKAKFSPPNDAALGMLDAVPMPASFRSSGTFSPPNDATLGMLDAAPMPASFRSCGARLAPNDAAALDVLDAALRGAFEGFTPAVWGVVLLKALNGILIPATFKYADNILYAYAKPSSIVVMTIASCVLARSLPSLSLMLGVSAVVGSIFLYSSKPKAK